ncbi:serine hydrolase [Pseudoalteromonas umbrosa]|uniref:serine hydrolase n=1 Tax=Pseudoalteromonas umbrosa TaxID=3048489 RepID=UPI0024C39EE8|nr:serine hydrolase [Pseudoalteromonas sp. B95]MDK1289476.1 serine hydrolase [Pseudoalteromonas sp. B95]
MRKALWRTLCCATTLIMSSNVVALTAPQLSEIEKSVQQAMDSFEIPGLAIGIVHDGKVVLAKGYGVRQYGKKDGVDEHTLFGIASNSKAFTATALGMLVEEGKLNWDDPVTKHLPEFQLYSQELTEQMTIRDLLSHRSGLALGAGDLMIWPDTDKSTKEILAGLKHIKPVAPLRTEYHYNNLMFVVAGEVVARVSGISWQAFIETRIFPQVGFKNSYASFSRIDKGNTNFATGTIKYNGQLEEFVGDYLEDFRGAGAIASNVADMTKWLKTQVNEGKAPTGKQLINRETHQYLWHPQIMRIPNDEDRIQFQQDFKGYALGWAVESYFGYKRVGHMGGILGMGSQVAMIPEKGLGVVILSNQHAYPAIRAITNEVFEQALDLEPRDWVLDSYQQFKQKRASLYAEIGPKKVVSKTASLSLSDYTGTLRSPWYGDVIVEEIAGQLHIDFTHTKLLKGTLHHHDGNTFVVKWHEKLLEADAYIHFKLNDKQQVQSADMEWVNPEITDFSFDFHNLDLSAVPQPY